MYWVPSVVAVVLRMSPEEHTSPVPVDIYKNHGGIGLDVLNDKGRLQFSRCMLDVLHDKHSKLDMLSDTGPWCCIEQIRRTI